MFTGIIQTKGKLIRLDRNRKPCRVIIDLGEFAQKVSHGDSVALDGCCLTATQIESSGRVSFDAVPETLFRTTLGSRSSGYLFNVELAVTPTTHLGGHFVQGHVDGMGTVESVRSEEGQRVIAVGCDKSLTARMVEKGSIALNGVSLTLTTVAETAFSVALIPTTLELTNLENRKSGDSVNIETDMILKYVAKLLGGNKTSGGITESFLKEHGFA